MTDAIIGCTIFCIALAIIVAICYYFADITGNAKDFFNPDK